MVVLDCLKRNGMEVIGFFDNNDQINNYCEVPVHAYDTSLHMDQQMIVSIGDNAIRKRIAEKVSHHFGVVVDPSAIIARDVSIGEGTVVFHMAVLQAGTQTGKHVIINTSASIDHECLIGDYVHIGPNVTLCGNVSVGEGSQIGAAAVVIPGISIGSWSVIGAGTVIRETVPHKVVVVGSPGRIIKCLEE